MTKARALPRPRTVLFVVFLPPGSRGTPWDPQGSPGGSLELTKKKNCGVPGDPRDERKTSPEHFFWGPKFLFGNFLKRFFVHKSSLNHIIDGFELIETWGIDRGMPWFNYGVEWTDRMPVHGRFTF